MLPWSRNLSALAGVVAELPDRSARGRFRLSITSTAAFVYICGTSALAVGLSSGER